MKGAWHLETVDNLRSAVSLMNHLQAIEARRPIRRGLFGGLAGAPSSRGGDWL
jgi:hypothetical protein